MKRARTPLLTLAGLILLGTVLLWVGTRGRGFWLGTNSLPGEHRLWVGGGCGRIGFDYVDSKRYPALPFTDDGFVSYPMGELYRAYLDKSPDFRWTSDPGKVNAWCPTWFPGTLLGGLLLGWGLLCRRDGERISEPKEPR